MKNLATTIAVAILCASACGGRIDRLNGRGQWIPRGNFPVGYTGIPSESSDSTSDSEETEVSPDDEGAAGSANEVSSDTEDRETATDDDDSRRPTPDPSGALGTGSTTPETGTGGSSGKEPEKIATAGTPAEPDEGAAGAKATPDEGAAGATDAEVGDDGSDVVGAAGATGTEPEDAGVAGASNKEPELGTAGASANPDEGGAGATAPEPAKARLVARLAEDTPSSQIVVPSASVPVALYVVSNEGNAPASIKDIEVAAGTSSAQLRDLAYMGVGIDGKGCVTIGYAGESFEDSTVTVEPGLSKTPECGTIIDPGGSVVVELNATPRSPIPNTRGTTKGPQSGDVFSLKLASLTASDGSEGVVEEHEVPRMVLRKARPTITWEPVTETLHEGLNTLAKLKIDATDTISFQQIAFNVDLSGVTLDVDGIEPFLVQGKEVKSSCYEGIGPEAGALVFCQDGIEQTVVGGGAGPVTIEVRANATNVAPGAVVVTSLDTTYYDDKLLTVSLDTQFMPGVIASLTNSIPGTPGWIGPVYTSAFWWSDVSELPHQAYTYSASAPSSADFTTAYLVPGADGSSTVSAP